jgi:hypothetical protein
VPISRKRKGDDGDGGARSRTELNLSFCTLTFRGSRASIGPAFGRDIYPLVRAARYRFTFLSACPVTMHSHVQVGDEILAVNLVDVTHMSLDDVVIIMSIPRRLVLATRHGPHQPISHSRQSEHKAPPVVVIKRDLNEDESDHATSNHVRYRLGQTFIPAS